MLLAGIGLAACQQVNGSESFLYFTQEILEKAGFASRTYITYFHTFISFDGEEIIPTYNTH